MAKMSRILSEVLESAEDLHRIGLIDTETMRKFQALCRERASSKPGRAGCKPVR
jgi:hypothetical protein